MRINQFKETAQELYLDYFNNFLTVEAFAHYYGFTEEFASALIHQEREKNK